MGADAAGTARSLITIRRTVASRGDDVRPENTAILPICHAGGFLSLGAGGPARPFHHSPSPRQPRLRRDPRQTGSRPADGEATLTGINGYTGWFAGDRAQMEATSLRLTGPCHRGTTGSDRSTAPRPGGALNRRRPCPPRRQVGHLPPARPLRHQRGMPLVISRLTHRCGLRPRSASITSTDPPPLSFRLR